MEKYVSKLNEFDTQNAISLVKEKFASKLCENLNLSRVSAPLFVKQGSGINDDLNGVERPVSFDILETGEIAEVVHSLAKWKRMALLKYGFPMHAGLYTDMNAIRRDEVCDNLHSIYVDQWDWEKIITAGDRTDAYLKQTVKSIYSAVLDTAKEIEKAYPVLDCYLPQDITFVSTYELEEKYPDLTPKQREYQAAKQYGAVFIMKIGGRLKNGEKHDGRAPDYDDWNLNGDIVLYNRVLDIPFEISSMGIRVDRDSLLSQLKAENKEERTKYEFHKMLISGALPLTIGGGIGQSRLSMFLLHKAHIGEVQVSIWPEKEVLKCKANGINLL
ncbi:MAG: aspartate--ammonia ligase [Acutalibacteraceae bacterium]|nr:aspartate--ammonia ligase [Acutalibacteraceae bacterium]